MFQEEAIISFLLFTSAGLVAFGSYRALRFAEGQKRWIGVLIPILYLFGWLIVPLLGAEAWKHDFQHSREDTPMGFATGVNLTSYVLMTVAAFAGMLCIRFFFRPDDDDARSPSPRHHDAGSDARKSGDE